MSDETPEEFDETDLIPAEANPWWHLANYYGVPTGPSDPNIEHNRQLWNNAHYSILSLEKINSLKSYLSKKNTPYIWLDPAGNIQGVQKIPEDKLKQILRKCMDRSKAIISDDFDYSILLKQTDFRKINLKNNIYFSGFLFGGIFLAQNGFFKKEGTFRHALFLDFTDFRNATFKEHITFEDNLFLGSLKIEKATFLGGASFVNSVFNDAHFDETTYLEDSRQKNITEPLKTALSKGAHFDSCKFQGVAIFDGCKFRTRASFNATFFAGFAIFQNAHFKSLSFTNSVVKGVSSFLNVIFEEQCSFNGTELDMGVFKNTIFQSAAEFKNVTFVTEADFMNTEFQIVTFNNAKFQSHGTFENCTFQFPPLFHGAKIHQSINWNVKSWPTFPPHVKPDSDKNTNSLYIVGANFNDITEWENAWATLKLHMNAQHRHDLEQQFFSKELDVKKWKLEKEAGDKTQRLAFYLYKKWSEYGQSVWLPIQNLFTFFVAFLPVYLLGSAFDCYMCTTVLGSLKCSILSLGETFKISLANTIPILGLHKFAYPDHLTVSVMALSVIHSLISLVLLFLLGLGLRNKFRIK